MLTKDLWWCDRLHLQVGATEMATSRFFLIGLTVLLPFQTLDAAVDTELMAEFRNAVAQTGATLDAVVVAAKCTVKTTFETADLEFRKIIKDKYGEAGQPLDEFFRCSLDGKWPLQASAKDNIAYVMACNDRYAFAVSRGADVEKYSVQWLEQSGHSLKTDTEIKVREAEARSVLVAPWLVLGVPLSEAVRSSEFVFTSIQEKTHDNQRRVKVTFDYLPLDDQQQRRNAHIVCDPSHHWAITEFVSTTPKGVILTETIESQPLASGFPIGTALRKEIYDPDPDGTAPDGNRSFTTRIDVTAEILSEQVDKSEFYLSHYGLPEPTFESAAWYRAPWVLLVAGLALLGIGASLIRQRRGSKAAA